MKVQTFGVARRQADEIHGDALGESGLMDSQPQGEYSDQEIGHRLRKAVQGLADAGDSVDQHQQYHASEAGHGDGYGFSGP